MENNAIAKTLLSIWAGLKDYEAMLNDRAQNHALCSFNSPLVTERIIDKIIDLNVKCQTIHTLRLGLDRLLGRLDGLTQQVLRTHFRPFETARNTIVQAARLGLAERTYFRHITKAINYLANHLHQLGINFFSWQNLLQNHRWIKDTWLREAHRRH